jgi:hypothetical protein
MQLARQSFFPHLSAVVLSQALLLLPQVNEQAPPCVQSTTKPLHDCPPLQATAQAYSPWQLTARPWQDFRPAQSRAQGLSAGHWMVVFEQSPLAEQSILQTPPSQLVQGGRH